ncbi:hypothetical protein FRC07_001375 [Ceratobasidium sp. 392]|nr:hypothetical protein FRC07_001375 [Ceratobasidium sp. 392]
MSRAAARSARGTRRIAQEHEKSYVIGMCNGKHFGWVYDFSISFTPIIDFGLAMWTRQDNGKLEPDDDDSEFTQGAFSLLERLYNRHKDRELDAKPSEIYQGLYAGNTLPTSVLNPYLGFMEGEVFIAALKIIFTGKSSVKGGAGAGIRSKAASNDMTSRTIPSLAYVATLAAAGCTYGVINFLEAEGFEEEIRQVIKRLNREIFPHSHRRPRAIDLDSEENSMSGMLAAARATHERQASGGGDDDNAGGVPATSEDAPIEGSGGDM